MASRKRSTPTILRARRRLRPSLLELEQRMLLSNLVVTNTDDSGSGSLRDAIGAAQNGDTIVFGLAPGSTITLTGGVIDISHDVTIQGPGASLLTISGHNTQEIFSVTAPSGSGSGAVLSGLTCSQGYGTTGAIDNNEGSRLTMIGCAVSGNAGVQTGPGGIYNRGTLVMTGCTVSENTTESAAGGIFNRTPYATLTLTNSTVSANTTPAILNLYAAAATLTDCTVAGNTDGASSAIGTSIDSSLVVNNTIVADNGGGEIGGSYSGSHNLVGGDPKLSPLGYNGGLIPTIVPLAGSPAIGAGDPSLVPAGITTDERGAARFEQGKVDIGAVETTPTIVVTTLNDEDDPIIDPTLGSGTSLREAIAFANADPYGADTIAFAPGLGGTISLTLGPLIIAHGMTITGPGADSLTIDGGWHGSTPGSLIFGVNDLITATISGLDIAYGYSNQGAIENSGTLTLNNCIVAASGSPQTGPIDNLGTLTLNNDLIANNRSVRGAIVNGGSGLVTLNTSTVSGNSSALGGGIDNEGALTLITSTVSGNSSALGGGIYNKGTLTLNESTVSGNTSASGGGIYNKGGLTITGGAVTGNTVGMTDVTQYYGGGIFSAAGSTTTLTGCTVSGNTVFGYGGGIAGKGNALTITDCKILNNSAHATTGALSGRGGGLWTASDTVSMVGCTVSGNVAAFEAGGIYLRSLSGTMTRCTVSNNQAGYAGGGIQNGSVLEMTDCTVSGNTAVLPMGRTDQGGGIWNTRSLTMTGCTISENVAAGWGGGISDDSNGGLPIAMTLTNCTIYDNAAYISGGSGYGGGLFSLTQKPETLTNCTVVGNRASFPGAGGDGGGDIFIYLRSDNHYGKDFTLNNSIVAGSQTAGGDIVGRVAHGNNNVIDDANLAGGLAAADGNILVSNPLLTILGFHGGPTQTMALLLGSPAINAGSTAFIPAGTTTDQRGVPRTRGNTVDVGAVESGPVDIVVTTLADEDDGAIDPTLGTGTSLREAIAFASADVYGDTITFAPGLAGTLSLSLGALPALAAPMTIVGGGAVTVDAGSASGILSVDAGVTATVSGLTLAHGSATAGGALENAGTLTLTDCVLTGNTAANGGAVSNSGSLTLSGCTLTGNSASGYGGALYNYNAGSMTLNACTIAGNSAADGGGVCDGLRASLTLTGSTVSGNTASSYGGGIDAYNAGQLTLSNCTVAGNSAVGGGGIATHFGKFAFSEVVAILSDCTVSGNSAVGGGGIANLYGEMTLNNTIVAINSGGDVESNIPPAGGNDLIGDASGGFRLTNTIAGDPLLGPLAPNGGPTQTMALLGGSPAINAGSNALIPSGIATDQRGAVRVKDGTVDIGAFESGSSTVVVTTLADEDDGTIDPALGSGTSLREAINYVNNIDPDDGVAVTFASGLEGAIDLTLGMLPAISGFMAITGPGAGTLTIDGEGTSRILSIQYGSKVIISGLTLTDGHATGTDTISDATGWGGGILNDGGTLTLKACALTNNTANFGGAVFNNGASTLTLLDSTVSGNTANSSGGGIYNFGGATLTNCTVADNGAVLQGGGILSSTLLDLALNDCTVAGNSAASGGGILTNSFSAAVTLNNTIVAGSKSGQDVVNLDFNPITGANDLIGDGSGGIAGALTGDPKLGPLAFNGGPTQTMALLAGSPAIDAGDNTLVPLPVTTDQRGVTRFNGTSTDIGAFESGETTIVVTTLADVDDETIDPFAGTGTSLREAIAFADAAPGGDDTIVFSPLLKGAIDLSNGPLPDITSDMTITGPGANVLTIDGGGTSRILTVQGGASVTISGLTFADGRATGANTIGDATGWGGAILNDGTLTLNACALTNNTADFGGAVFNGGSGTLKLLGSTVSGNTANSSGGGIYNFGGATLTNCTVADNGAALEGGGILSSTLLDLALNDCTVAGNSAASGGGILSNSAVAVVTLNNTIVAGSTSGQDVVNLDSLFNPITGANDLIGDGSGGIAGALTGDPKLGPLAFNGGPTQTMALLAGSPAIGTGAAPGVTTDQRGFGLDSPPDIGAFQYQGPAPTVTISGPSTGIVQVEATFTLTATDPTPADQNGTFTYTIDWNGDGRDVQTVMGPASLQVAHAYLAAGSFTPVVTVLDQDHRGGGPAALATPVVVAGLDGGSFSTALASSVSLTLNVGSIFDEGTALTVINNAPADAWNDSAPVHMDVTSSALLDAQFVPASDDAQIDVEGHADLVGALFNVDNGGDDPELQRAATVLVIAGVLAAASAGAGIAFLPAATSIAANIGAVTAQIGIISTVAGVSGGTGAIVGGVDGMLMVGASPALVVENGTVTVSNGWITTVTDAPAIIVKGGTLVLENDCVLSSPNGSRPAIEVDGGTLVLGAPVGTEGDLLGAYGSAPFIQVTGGGKVIVEGRNAFDQISSQFTAQDAGTTVTQLVSSNPTAIAGETVTFTATVTASGSPASDGAVEFFDATTKTYLGTVAVNNGSASLDVTLNTLTTGDSIYATYLPTTGALAPSSGETTQGVADATTTTVTGPASTLTYGQTATFTATVANTTNGDTPAGSVEFFDGSTDLGPGTVLSGSGGTAVATFTTATLTAGAHTITAVYTPSGTFQASSGTLSQTINQATPTITWANPADIVYGTALSGTQLNATANVPGTFTYTPAAGTVLSAGDDQTLSVSFAPTDAIDYTTATATALINVNEDGTTTSISSSLMTANFGQSVTFTATITASAPGSGTPTGTVDFFDTTTNTDLTPGGVALSSGSASFTTASLDAGSHTITASYSGDSNFLASSASTGTITINPSILVLDPSASGALSVSGNASISVTGGVYVNSSSSSALTASGNASIKASVIDVHGGVSKSGNARFSPAPVTGAATVTDPLSGLTEPSPSGLTNYGSVSIGGNSRATINPGIYSQITVSGNAKLTMSSGINGGIYIIEGGGLSVSGNATVSGSGVMIVNAGSQYPATGGTYGGITLSGNGSFNLSPQTTGVYAGLLIFQPGDNTKKLSVSGNCSAITGTIYAPAAPLAESGNASLSGSIVVDDLTVSGNAVADVVVDALDVLNGEISQELLIGDLAFEQVSIPKTSKKKG